MAPPSTPVDAEKGPNQVYCRDCGSVISERAEICPDCGVRQQDPPSGASDLFQGGNPVLAALLSALLPGLGQIYNRELERGLAFVVASVVSGVLVAFVVGILIYPLVWVFAIYDAYTRAEQAYRDRTAPTRDGRDTAAGVPGRELDDEKAAADDWGARSRTDNDNGTDSNGSNRR
jgi:TM2 domain-containing membrane protein YozV